MTLFYKSTRDSENVVSASQAILQGLAVDGGLYVPTEIPETDLDFKHLANQSYQEIAALIMQLFLPDFTQEELYECINKAYDQKFDNQEITPLVKVGDQYYLELFHGPTLAFKDIALSILPHLMKKAAQKNNMAKEIVILTATSGDTGKSAMEGFADVKNTRIIVFYPESGVSPIQKKQMITQKGENTFVTAIKGNFDDAQRKVKELFNDENLRSKMADNNKVFSSANSINIGRLVPQIVYYVYAYTRLVKSGQIESGEEVNFSVPTGNFGDILAGFYAKKIGLPIRRLICASNQNNVLTEFFQTGNYDRNRPFYVTSSPSMDILVSSNLERLLFYLTKEDTVQTKQLMDDLNKRGNYKITAEMKSALSDFFADFASEKETDQTIREVYEKGNYVIDPHTAVATCVANKYEEKMLPTIILSTASPYKFPQAVLQAINNEGEKAEGIAALNKLETFAEIPVPAAIEELENAEIKHNDKISAEEMTHYVEKVLNLK
ncbi:threonine synthase [Tetragenococcus halophilus]|uniref:Threonine synthase n=1 Tax=Tetragenococcus halophilus TaxID=51669 RepID=A0AB35HPY3_TETHA|nr:threonine synthase [Tetragenococcus halophilus]MCO8297835.1 threonine synthase [Tetragenococcus halophilus]